VPADTVSEGVEMLLLTMLQSPWFLYAVELGLEERPLLSSWEQASRVSYALWATMPSPAMFMAAAKTDHLNQDALEAAADGRFRGRIQDFVNQ
jgi:hypothetical protein